MHSRRSILIVEDDRFLARAYETAFESLDCELIILFDGADVVKTMQEKKPAVVLLDILIPQKDGFQILTELSKNPQLRKIPVIVASNLGQEEEIARATSLGAVAYIVKSDTSIADVVKTVKHYL